MWLVLCEMQDVAAQWAYHGLLARGLEPIELLTSAMLARAVSWKHTLGVEQAQTTITLADGRRIFSTTIHGTLNRLLAAPSAFLSLALPTERAYASQELTAFYLSWLHALPGPVLNRPTPRGLSGAWRRLSEWALLAAQSGLPVSPCTVNGHDETGCLPFHSSLAPPGTPIRTVLLVANRVIGSSVPETIASGCKRLGVLSDTSLLGIDFAESTTGYWTFVGATPLPDLRQGGEALLDALATTMKGT
ncbi:MAG: hypothetical protein JW846_10620 [Dehalococcoidia bacterium]|nr:hypothetical protein [Dehalococcoidia bacterium]